MVICCGDFFKWAVGSCSRVFCACEARTLQMAAGQDLTTAPARFQLKPTQHDYSSATPQLQSLLPAPGHMDMSFAFNQRHLRAKAQAWLVCFMLCIHCKRKVYQTETFFRFASFSVWSWALDQFRNLKYLPFSFYAIKIHKNLYQNQNSLKF